jgi:acyl carrier protein
LPDASASEKPGYRRKDVVEWVHRFLDEHKCSIPRGSDVSDLFTEGSLDSLAIVALIVGLESTFGIHLTEQDLGDPRLSTVSGLASLVVEVRGRSALT